MKGIALVGVLKALVELDFMQYFDTYAGTSIGSVILALFMIGYSDSELFKFIKKFNFEKIRSIDFMGVLSNLGLDNGNKLVYVIRRLIKAKNISEGITLKELYEKTKIDFYVTTVCLNDMNVVYLNYKTHPDMELIMALRMSTSIPWYYVPVNYMGKLYVDGGVIDNYPIGLFKDDINNVLGVYLIECNDTVEEIPNIEMYTFRVIQSFFKGIGMIMQKSYKDCTIEVHLESINILNYDVDKNKLFNIGYESVMERFKD